VQALGANALAAAAAATSETAPRQPRAPAAEERSDQAVLFVDENSPKVIPFSRKAGVTMESLAETAELFPPKAAVQPKPKAAPKRKPGGDPFGNQTTLDFLPTASPQKSRTLKTTVEAVIYCDAPVAGPMHRAMAATLDASMIFIAFGIFLVIFQIFGGPFAWNKQNIALFAASLGLIAMFYGFVWMMAGRETMGMSWADLRIINFNGFPPDRKSRALRMVGCWLSFCSGTIGIFWALVDEENLTWHDHMSKTFPTLREGNTGFFRP
jgi:uncharacterized RDD family membrane protein YckC